jgi:hypothetical protein
MKQRRPPSAQPSGVGCRRHLTSARVQIGKAWEYAPSALADIEFEIDSWWLALTLAGLLYSELRLVCVAPADLRIPDGGIMTRDSGVITGPEGVA